MQQQQLHHVSRAAPARKAAPHQPATCICEQQQLTAPSSACACDRISAQALVIRASSNGEHNTRRQ
jgi:hypothetical protein